MTKEVIGEYWRSAYCNEKHKKEELEAQIEKMKCCENCIHHSYWGDEVKCKLSYDEQFRCDKDKSKWELDVK